MRVASYRHGCAIGEFPAFLVVFFFAIARSPEAGDNVLTVYRPLDPNKEFIAKKVRKGSDERHVQWVR